LACGVKQMSSAWAANGSSYLARHDGSAGKAYKGREHANAVRDKLAEEAAAPAAGALPATAAPELSVAPTGMAVVPVTMSEDHLSRVSSRCAVQFRLQAQSLQQWQMASEIHAPCCWYK
jgi:hypothetical protein